jgi:hypothetical protein
MVSDLSILTNYLPFILPKLHLKILERYIGFVLETSHREAEKAEEWCVVAKEQGKVY